jgi:glycosyltransferase involved in cell wall biosynthesis
MLSLSMVVPSYNEKELLESFVRKSIADLRATGRDFELVLVDDGSTDGSLQIAQRLAAELAELKVVDLGRNYGTGANIREGFKHATKDVVFVNTVDGVLDTLDLPAILPFVDEYEVVSAYRTDLSANNPYQKLLTMTNIFLIRLLFPLKLRAYQSVQFHRRRFLQAVRIEAGSSFVSPELLIKASVLGYRIKEVPVRFHARKAGTPKGGKPIHVFRSLRDVFGFWYRWVVRGGLRQMKASMPAEVRMESRV